MFQRCVETTLETSVRSSEDVYPRTVQKHIFSDSNKTGPEVSGSTDQTSGNPGSPHMHQCISYETTNLIQVTSLWLHRMRIPQTSPKQFDPCLTLKLHFTSLSVLMAVMKRRDLLHPSYCWAILLEMPQKLQPTPPLSVQSNLRRQTGGSHDER